MRKQLRPFYTAEELARVYEEPYDHTRWPDHIDRVRHTAEILHSMDHASVADLSCGDGAIVRQAGLTCPVTLGDYNGNWDWTGPIELAIDLIDPVDVFVLSETLEHVQDPDNLLRKIRAKADRLLLSTPCGEVSDENPQHYWGWDAQGIQEMLSAAMWRPLGNPEMFNPPPHYYTFQIWRCE